MAAQPGLFNVGERLQRLSDIGDQLEAYAAVVDFELFRPDLETALGYSDGSKGGRPAYDPVLMFKILVIQAQNGLSDDKTEFLINDRLSFMRFLGLGLSDRVPDAKTIWVFRERLTRAGRDRWAVPAVRRGHPGGRVHRDVGPARRQHLGGGTQAAQYAGREAGREGGEDGTRNLAESAGEGAPERHGRPLDNPDRQGPTRWGSHAAGHCDPELRLQDPHEHRPTLSIDPVLGGHGRQSARRALVAPRLARPHEHRRRRLGGYGVSLAAE